MYFSASRHSLGISEQSGIQFKERSNRVRKKVTDKFQQIVTIYTYRVRKIQYINEEQPSPCKICYQINLLVART